MQHYNINTFIHFLFSNFSVSVIHITTGHRPRLNKQTNKQANKAQRSTRSQFISLTFALPQETNLAKGEQHKSTDSPNAAISSRLVLFLSFFPSLFLSLFLLFSFLFFSRSIVCIPFRLSHTYIPTRTHDMDPQMEQSISVGYSIWPGT